MNAVKIFNPDQHEGSTARDRLAAWIVNAILAGDIDRITPSTMRKLRDQFLAYESGEYDESD